MTVRQELYSIKEAALVLGTSRDFVADKIADGSLPAWQIGKGQRAVKRVRRDDLNALLRPVPVVGHNPDALALK